MSDAVIRLATPADIDGILAVLEHNLIVNQAAVDISVLEGGGFLINSFTADDVKASLADKKNHLVLVCEDNEQNIVGYIMGFAAKKLTPAWRSQLDVSDEMISILDSGKAFFHKHIAKRTSTPGIGKKLLQSLLDEAKTRGFEYVICQIAEKPLKNKKSITFHESFGFQLMGFGADENRIYGVYLKKL